VVLSPPACRAGPLPVTFAPGGPVIQGINGTVTYDAATGNFHSTTSALTFNSPSVPGGFTFFGGNGQVSIDLQVNSSGGFVGNGSGVTVTGSLDLDGDGQADVSGDATHPLLSGSIFAFGATPPSASTALFDGLFTIQGGQLTQSIALSGGGSDGPFFHPGTTGGFLLFAESASSGTPGDFSQSFSSSSVKGDYGPVVPEPSTLTLWLAAAVPLGALGLWHRRRRPAD
jgi:hypothetical protein